MPPLVIRALESRLTRADEIALERLRDGLDRVARRRKARHSPDNIRILFRNLLIIRA
jgi:hypothetical protein